VSPVLLLALTERRDYVDHAGGTILDAGCSNGPGRVSNKRAYRHPSCSRRCWPASKWRKGVILGPNLASNIARDETREASALLPHGGGALRNLDQAGH
jgi:hypothetical protein